MTNEYKEFVEELRNVMIEEGGIPKEKIRFCTEQPGPSQNDKLLVEAAVLGEKTAVCGIYVGQLFSFLQDGMAFSDIKDKVLQNLKSVDEELLEELDRRIGTYESAREYLVIRAVNYPRNRTAVESSVYKVIGDIALVVYAVIREYEDSISSVKISRHLLNIWGKTEDEVYEAAMENTRHQSPPRLFQLPEVLLDPDYEGIDFMKPGRESMLRGNEIGNCISTTRRINGAVAIFMPGVAARIAEVLNSDLYLAFTSIHEVMVHCAETVDPKGLERVLADTIRETTEEEEFLSRKLYHYSRGTGLFSQITQIVETEQ
ncbi:MAG: hypothetical protein IJX90_03295 [Blautia sp.]|nr:hypothetical protein [Blautia sp.]